LTKKVDLLAARSKFVKNVLRAHGYSKITVKYNFVPKDFDNNILPKGEGDILYIGKLLEQKGPHLLIDAIPNIIKYFPNQKFTFLGEGPLMKPLKKKVEKFEFQKNVRFFGWVNYEEVKSRIKGAKLVVSPSLWFEPLSRVIIESHSLGTPVLSSNRGGNNEINHANLIFNPLKDNLSLKIIKILNSERPKKVKIPTQQEIIEDWIKTYNKLMNDNH
jgi:glycosyltransferase involved in cell wall biosynthesis